MALKISKNSGLTDIVSTDGSNPITTQHPITGGAQTLTLYLFNDNAAERFENITIDPTDAVSTDESSWVELSADGTTWQTAGAPLTMANISDSNVGKVFYARVTSPAVGSVQNKTDIKLTVNYSRRRAFLCRSILLLFICDSTASSSHLPTLQDDTSDNTHSSNHTETNPSFPLSETTSHSNYTFLSSRS